MKKSLLALAVLGAFAGTASAQTAVTIYGVVDAGYRFEKNTLGTDGEKLHRLQSGQQSGSRLGFKGTEDLGGGLQGIFTLENGFSIDDGRLGQGSRLFGRQAWVGLNGGFGSVKLGRQQTPLYYALNAVDPFGINLAGNAQNFFAYGLYALDPLSRTDNTINYTTPNLGGFTGTVSYGFGEVAGDTTARRQTAAGLAYVNGPLNVQVAYHKANDADLTSATDTAIGAVRGVFGATPDVRTAFVGATFDFGVAKAHAAYADSKAETTAEIDNRNLMLGVSAPIGPGTVMASYNRNDLRDIDEGATDHYAIGYSHAVSKRTNLYTSFGYTKNDDGVALNAYRAGESSRLFNVGVRHTF
ncbi:porin [Noviherbaspirillum agri]